MIAILGAGHAGRAMAGDLGLRGAPVALWNRTAANIAVLRARGGVEVEGEVEGFGRVRLITDDLEHALADARLIIVNVPAFAHGTLGGALRPLLARRPDGGAQPGPNLRGPGVPPGPRSAAGCAADVVVAEAATNLMTARSTGPAQSYIARVKHAVPVAALRPARTAEVVAALNEWYPQFTAAASTLETSFSNVGAVIHPAITLLNAARIENDQGRFEFYMDGISPRVAGVLEAVDRERRAVAALLGVEVQSLVEWLASAYRATGSDLFEAVRANEGYRGITAPSTLEHRYILEDVPMSLVPIASAGRAFGLKSQAIESLILLAGLIMDTNYWTRGRTLESLGLAGLSPGRSAGSRPWGAEVSEERLVVGAALGDCVHTAGVLNFLAAARRAGYRTEFLGPAVPVARVVEAAAGRHTGLLALSYRLTPAAAERLFAQLRAELAAAGLEGQRLVFGGTPVVAEVAARTGLFEAVFGAPRTRRAPRSTWPAGRREGSGRTGPRRWWSGAAGRRPGR